jgi:hypothetical protein
MAFANAIQEVVECRVEGLLTSSNVYLGRWNNTWHFARDADDPFDFEDLPGLYGMALGVAAALHGRYVASIMPHLCDQCAIVTVRAKVVAPIIGPFAAFTNAVTGTKDGEMDEPDDAIVVTKRTYQPGRRYLGRIFVPGALDADVTGGVITNELAAEMADGFFTLIESPLATNGEDYRVGVWSALAYSEVPTVLAGFAEVIAIESDQVMRKQTRRDIKERIPTQGEQ